MNQLAGQIFGKWSVISFAYSKAGQGCFWKCQCICGREKPISACSLRNGTSTGCRHCATKHRGRTRAWTGNPWKSDSGYVKQWATDGKEVWQHRVVMEEHIGRNLLPSETVHHKNGIRDDNRLENLELRMGNHGKGQNIKDRVFDALRLLDLYNPEYLSNSGRLEILEKK